MQPFNASEYLLDRCLAAGDGDRMSIREVRELAGPSQATAF